MALTFFISHLGWGNPITSGYSPGCPDRSDVSMVMGSNGKCGDRYPYRGGSQTATVKWNWFECKKTNTCIHEKARLECFHLII